jgi:hypothetical protein
VDNGYEREFQDVYGAVNPLEGELDWMISPAMNTGWMGVCLAQVSAAHPENLIVMVVDGASSQVAKALVVPENIRLLLLPRLGARTQSAGTQVGRNPGEGISKPEIFRDGRRGQTLQTGLPRLAADPLSRVAEKLRPNSNWDCTSPASAFFLVSANDGRREKSVQTWQSISTRYYPHRHYEEKTRQRHRITGQADRRIDHLVRSGERHDWTAGADERHRFVRLLWSILPVWLGRRRLGGWSFFFLGMSGVPNTVTDQIRFHPLVSKPPISSRPVHPSIRGLGFPGSSLQLVILRASRWSPRVSV